MMKGFIILQNQADQEDVSNLTSASGEASNSYHQSSSLASTNPSPSKKKRGLPGNPDPEAEVIALSPKSLMATNRFVCEICHKGFQRDQNLQLHRRGHNLPWKLKQRSREEAVRKKVYVCPEPSCVHHEPSRALGDLTGIKKHFSRKHGEKRWKCERCSKKYAVQSDWKAHSKVCGTKEYRCDCGTLFSRRDSFITHRAFCDALAEESARATITANPLNMVQHQLLFNQAQNTGQDHHFSLMKIEQQQQQELMISRSSAAAPSDLPPWLSSSSSPTHLDLLPPHHPIFSGSIVVDGGDDPNHHHHHHQAASTILSSHHHPYHHQAAAAAAPAAAAHMSATALLQKAAQMGGTMSSRTSLQSQMAPLAPTSSASSAPAAAGFHEAGGVLEGFGGVLELKIHGGRESNEQYHEIRGVAGAGNEDQGMTRDFLGLRGALSRGDFLNMAVEGMEASPCMAGSSGFVDQEVDEHEDDHHHLMKPWLE